MRYVVHIVTSVICILFPICALVYIYWDASQPKTGPVGNGVQLPSIQELIPLFSTFLLGIINLPIAIIRYKENKRKALNGQHTHPMVKLTPQFAEEQADATAMDDNLRLREAKELIFALEAEIRRKRKYAEVYIAIESIDGDKEKDIETMIQAFLSRFGAFKPGVKLDEITEPDLSKLLEYALSKQMAHDLEAMSVPEARSIIRDFMRLFDSPERTIFTNGTYNNGLMWRSIMKERHGTVYFDTGAVVLTKELIGILWIADRG